MMFIQLLRSLRPFGADSVGNSNARPACFDCPNAWGSYDATGTPLAIRDPFSNRIRPVSPGETIQCDHILPRIEICREPGFGALTAEQQREILNAPFNLQPLPGVLNPSKSCRLGSRWKRYVKAERDTDPQYRTDLEAKQDEVRARIRDMIQAYAALNAL